MNVFRTTIMSHGDETTKSATFIYVSTFWLWARRNVRLNELEEYIQPGDLLFIV